jgi:hypothetical protein
MAVQGMALALRLKQQWEGIRLNETHPKILYYALSGSKYHFAEPMIQWLLDRFTPRVSLGINNDHEWDALISAWATWRGCTRCWRTDLMTNVTGLLLPAGPVTYFWPQVLQ